MYTPTKLKRIVACQGSIQLITALSALISREKGQNDTNIEYENYLVIYDLRTPESQVDIFANFIVKMAQEIYTWEAIVYIKPKKIRELQIKLNLVKLNFKKIQQVFSQIYQSIGISSTDEIYLSKNYDIVDRLLLNAYESAKKICYGDSIGFYLSASSSVLQVEPRSIGYKLKRLLKTFVKKQSMKEVNFDLGYFTISNFNILSEVPPMETVIVDKKVTIDVLQRLRGIVGRMLDSKYMTELRAKVKSNSVSILLTSNFSEAIRMSEKNEIAAYREFLESYQQKSNEILIIKPHPRDSAAKIERLKCTLSEIYSEVIVISALDWFFLPFELFLMEVFLNKNLVPDCNIRIFTFSSACLALKFLFNLPCSVGFGSTIASKLFYEEQISKRIKHELELKALLQEI